MLVNDAEMRDTNAPVKHPETREEREAWGFPPVFNSLGESV